MFRLTSVSPLSQFAYHDVYLTYSIYHQTEELAKHMYI